MSSSVQQIFSIIPLIFQQWLEWAPALIHLNVIHIPLFWDKLDRLHSSLTQIQETSLHTLCTISRSGTMRITAKSKSRHSSIHPSTATTTAFTTPTGTTVTTPPAAMTIHCSPSSFTKSFTAWVFLAICNPTAAAALVGIVSVDLSKGLTLTRAYSKTPRPAKC